MGTVIGSVYPIFFGHNESMTDEIFLSSSKGLSFRSASQRKEKSLETGKDFSFRLPADRNDTRVRFFNKFIISDL